MESTGPKHYVYQKGPLRRRRCRRLLEGGNERCGSVTPPSAGKPDGHPDSHSHASRDTPLLPRPRAPAGIYRRWSRLHLPRDAQLRCHFRRVPPQPARRALSVLSRSLPAAYGTLAPFESPSGLSPGVRFYFQYGDSGTCGGAAAPAANATSAAGGTGCEPASWGAVFSAFGPPVSEATPGSLSAALTATLPAGSSPAARVGRVSPVKQSASPAAPAESLGPGPVATARELGSFFTFPRRAAARGGTINRRTEAASPTSTAASPAPPAAAVPAGAASAAPPAPVASADRVRILAVGDMGTADLDGSNVPANVPSPSSRKSEYLNDASRNTTARLLADVQGWGASLLIHNGDISYARGCAATTSHNAPPSAPLSYLVVVPPAKALLMPLPLPHGRLSPNPTRFATLWDLYFDQVEPIATRVPLLATIGNHESNWPGHADKWNDSRTDSGGECGVPWERRFQMPGAAGAREEHPKPLIPSHGVPPRRICSAALSNSSPLPRPCLSACEPWFSVKWGPVHVSMISTEHSTAQGSRQRAWLERDLAAVDRRRAAWLPQRTAAL